MLLLGVVSCAAHLMITRALKLAPASTLAPLHYSLLLWAVVFGFVFFGDVPGPRMLVGSAIVVLAGLFIFHRQKVVDTVPPETCRTASTDAPGRVRLISFCSSPRLLACSCRVPIRSRGHSDL